MRRNPFSRLWSGNAATHPCGPGLAGSPTAQATMGPILLVLTTPGLGGDHRLAAVRDEFPVRALVAGAAVEALPVGVRPRAAQVYVPGPRPPLGQPALRGWG